MGSRLSSVIGIASLALLLGGTRSLAQEATTGTIEGQVVDAQGLAIPGATVIDTGAQGA